MKINYFNVNLRKMILLKRPLKTNSHWVTITFNHRINDVRIYEKRTAFMKKNYFTDRVAVSFVSWKTILTEKYRTLRLWKISQCKCDLSAFSMSKNKFQFWYQINSVLILIMLNIKFTALNFASKNHKNINTFLCICV